MKNFLFVQIALLVVFGSSLLISSYSKPSVIGLEVTQGSSEGAHILDQQVKLTFSRPMDKESVEKAFSIEPAIEGNISWSQNTLFFTPIKPLNYTTTYQIGVQTTAQDSYGKHIGEAYRRTFTTEQGRFVFVGKEDQLYISNLQGDIEQITKDLTISQYFVNRKARQIILVHNDKTTSLQRFSLLDLDTEEITPILDEFLGQIHFASYDDTSDTIAFNFDDGTTADYRRYIYTYNLATAEVSKIDSNNLITFAFWQLPNSSSILIQDLEARYFLYDTETNETQLIGTFIEYVGSNQKQGTLYFRQSRETSKVVSVGIENRELTTDDIVAALPTVNDENTLIAYSYKPKPEQLLESEPNFGLHIISIDSKEVINEIILKDKSLEYPTFAPNSQYLAVTTTTREQGQPSGYIIPSLRQRIGNNSLNHTIKILDVDTGTFLDIQIDGSHVHWL